MRYSQFHKTLPRSRSFVNRISVRFYEMGDRSTGRVISMKHAVNSDLECDVPDRGL